MSKFLRQMDALSKRPEHFKPKLVPPPHTVSESPTLSETPTVSNPPTLGNQLTESKSHRVRDWGYRKAVLVQDGHSTGEHAVYMALWNAGNGLDQHQRMVAIGYEKIARACGLHWTNVKKHLKTLEGKLAIEMVQRENSDTRTGKTYRVFGFAEILRRRKEARLEWVKKGTHTLCDLPTLSEEHTESESHREGVGDSLGATLSESLTPLGNKEFSKEDCSRCNGTGWYEWQGQRRQCGLH
jgi:DNA-binding MarR family transcriptional regulator